MDFSKHSQGTTSVKVHHAPGGQSNFSLGWSEPQKPNNNVQAQQPKKEQEITSKPNQAVYNQPNQPKVNTAEQPAAGKTSVKVHNPPGGKSSITFG